MDFSFVLLCVLAAGALVVFLYERAHRKRGEQSGEQSLPGPQFMEPENSKNPTAIPRTSDARVTSAKKPPQSPALKKAS